MNFSITTLIATFINKFYIKRIKQFEKLSKCKINVVFQGSGSIEIGHPENFKIDKTSALKSNTYIEAQGGVQIGRYFHTGGGLTIFSSNHDYDSNKFIPYSNESILKPVIIEDFVWCGANVTIVPGVKIGKEP